MFRRLFYLVLLAVFAGAGLLSAYLFHVRYLAWQQCADVYGRCLTPAPGPIASVEPTALALAYLAITFVLTLLSLWSLRGVMRRRRPAFA